MLSRGQGLLIDRGAMVSKDQQLDLIDINMAQEACILEAEMFKNIPF